MSGPSRAEQRTLTRWRLVLGKSAEARGICLGRKTPTPRGSRPWWGISSESPTPTEPDGRKGAKGERGPATP